MPKKDQSEAVRLALVPAFKITRTVAPVIRQKDEVHYQELLGKSKGVLAAWVGTYPPYCETEEGTIEEIMVVLRNHDINVLKLTEFLFNSNYLEAIKLIKAIEDPVISIQLLELVKALKS